MKILAVQNRMGIGDTVIFLPFIRAISEKYNSPISLLVKENSKANEFLYETNYIDKIFIFNSFIKFKVPKKPPCLLLNFLSLSKIRILLM